MKIASNKGLWISLLGGGSAWLAHFLILYVIAEWGCLDAQPHFVFWGIMGSAWAVIATTILAVIAGLLATFLAYQIETAVKASKPLGKNDESAATKVFAGQVGTAAGLLFTLIIVIESLPILFHLRAC